MGYQYFGDVTDASTPLSTKYTLGDLTITNQVTPNLPTTQDQMNNLVQLAKTLESLEAAIGPFTILSAFRSSDTQAALTSGGAPTAESTSGKLSFHEEGLAVDLTPTTMSPAEFFGKMCAIIGTTNQPGTWRGVFSEIMFKPSQNSIHLALAVPYKQDVYAVYDPAQNQYVRLSDDEVADYANQYGTQYGVSYQKTGDSSGAGEPVNIGDSSGSPGILLLGLIALGVFLVASQKPSRRLSPA